MGGNYLVGGHPAAVCSSCQVPATKRRWLPDASCGRVDTPLMAGPGVVLSCGGERFIPGWGDGGGRGEADFDVEASVGAWVDGQSGMVGLGDGRHDGQAETDAFVAGGPAGGQALERLEQPAGLAGRDDRRAGPGDRLLGAGRLPGRRAVPRL
jgi:hypothetical protein